MNKVMSADGTAIAYDRRGSGPALILVDGAMCWRAQGPSGPLADLLEQHFTVYTYDRRGRGESHDATTYQVEREIEDLRALIEEAGGAAHVYGISSGAALALEAANAGLPISSLALYEPPFIVDGTRPPAPADLLTRTQTLLASGKRGDAVKLFMTKGVNLPGLVVALMRFMPAWSKLKSVAHTLAYDLTIMGERQLGHPLPTDRWTALTMPALVADGAKSPTWIRNGARQLADVLPGAEHRTLPGQTHMVKPEALAPVLTAFFSGHDVPPHPAA
ncbi:alpha/beta fold hydrolase [Nonomuraea roseola]|uniref:Alpha/beta fold hydrolase n=1 Tax=Nonomuraea roseola TaxID=46179 RepID=A0ABV5QBA3_9ACTN